MEGDGRFPLFCSFKRKKVERIPFGSGSGEMIDPVWMPLPDGNFGVLDRNQQRMDVYPGHSLLVNDSVKPVKRISYFGDYPEAYRDGTTYEKYMEFTADLAAKPDGSRWVVAHRLTDLIEIYDNHLKLVKRIQGPDGFFPEMEEVGGQMRHSKNERSGYFFPFATDDNIYVLYGLSDRPEFHVTAYKLPKL